MLSRGRFGVVQGPMWRRRGALVTSSKGPFGVVWGGLWIHPQLLWRRLDSRVLLIFDGQSCLKAVSRLHRLQGLLVNKDTHRP